jgi:hypothetical protein
MENYHYLNGRVNAYGDTPNSYNLQKQQPNVTESPQNITSRNLNCTAVSSMFFSAENMDILQMGMRNQILNETRGKYKIGRQSDDELKIVMRSIYYQHSKNMPNNIKEQVRDLNTKVIDWCVPQIITNLKQDEKYRQDISTLPEPLERSVLTSQKGTKSLEMKSYV